MEIAVKSRIASVQLPKIVEHDADAKLSGIIARSYSGHLIELERVPELILDSRFMDSIRKTSSYSRHGDVWFWTGTVGTELNGYYKINPEGRDVKDRFVPIKRDSSLFGTRDCRQVALFLKGDMQLSVSIISAFTFAGRDITVSGAFRDSMPAPLVVIDNANAGDIRKAVRR